MSIGDLQLKQYLVFAHCWAQLGADVMMEISCKVGCRQNDPLTPFT